MGCAASSDEGGRSKKEVSPHAARGTAEYYQQKYGATPPRPPSAPATTRRVGAAARRLDEAFERASANNAGPGPASNGAAAEAAARSQRGEGKGGVEDEDGDVFHDALPAFVDVPASPGPPPGGTAAGKSLPSESPPPLLEEDWGLPHEPDLPLTAAARSRAVDAMQRIVLAAPDTAAAEAFEDRTRATLERFLRARDFHLKQARACSRPYVLSRRYALDL